MIGRGQASWPFASHRDGVRLPPGLSKVPLRGMDMGRLVPPPDRIFHPQVRKPGVRPQQDALGYSRWERKKIRRGGAVDLVEPAVVLLAQHCLLTEVVDRNLLYWTGGNLACDVYFQIEFFVDCWQYSYVTVAQRLF